MKRIWFVLTGLAVLAGQVRGPAQSGPVGDAEFEVTPAAGPWMILTTSYTGPEAKAMAHKLLAELRTNYKLSAYVFNYGDEERRKEHERVEKLRQQQREYLAQMNLAPNTPIRVRTRRFEDQCAVLLGGYKDQDAARRDLDRIKKLKPPDPTRVPQHALGITDPIRKGVDRAFLSPFAQAFVVPNPTVKREPAPDQGKPDPFLKKLNANEPLSLLKCPKPWTLAVAQFQGATVVQSSSTSSSFLEKLGLGSQGGEMLNGAARSAESVAELLRKLNFDAYVLHTRYSSVVSVGGFDSPDDAQLKATQERLARLKLDPIPIMSPTRPMPVPQF